MLVLTQLFAASMVSRMMCRSIAVVNRSGLGVYGGNPNKSSAAFPDYPIGHTTHLRYSAEDLLAYRHETTTIDFAIDCKNLPGVAGHANMLRRSRNTLRKGAFHG
jgi:hypothetical protein